MTASTTTDCQPLSPLTIPYLLEIQETGSLDSLPSSTKEELVPYLESNGVIVVPSASLEDCQAAAKRLQPASFWPRHASLHPKANRVKNWLWVHSRYRDQAKAILKLKNDLPQQKTDFTKVHGKIEAHSVFEDTQLFKYFSDAKIGDAENLQKLYDQHKDLRTAQAIQEGYLKVRSGDGSYETDVQPHLEAYAQDLMEHLKLEEETIVQPWLQLTDDQYKKYRSYLSWKYCIMY
jgi:hypothetical protein